MGAGRGAGRPHRRVRPAAALVFVALPVALGGPAGCSSAESGEEGQPEVREGQGAEFDVILRESTSGITDRRREVLRTERAWEAFWEEVHAGRRPSPERPSVDFSERMVVVAAMGERSTGGHAIVVEEVARGEEGYRVRVRETSPGKDCVVTQALTQPVTAVALPDGEREVSFEERETVDEC